jgi:glycosyltransferase involved in cell wall biosynthesis
MRSVLIIYNYILHYRKPLFNLLSKDYNLTVIHSGERTVSKTDEYNEIIVPVVKLGPVFYQKGVLSQLENLKYDIVIALFDVRWISTLAAFIYKNRTSQFIWWGAWITKNKLANYIRIFLAKKSDKNVFYTAEAKNQFLVRGVSQNILYVANNTFDVGEPIKSYENENKTRILFVGSLDKRKQNDVLIDAFHKVLDIIPENILLTLIGEGIQKDNLQAIVHENDLEKRVEFVGKITDPGRLRDFYREAIFSVSFGQAGLTVLQSLGYGVPFMTKINAISGGEKTNIKHGHNGIFCEDSITSLTSYIVELCNDIDHARMLGKNAYNYYQNYCTMGNMAQGFKDAMENTRYANIDEWSNTEK